MRRWVVPVLRSLLACIGVLALAWIPLSFSARLHVMLPWPGSYSITTVHGGHVSATMRDDPTFARLPVQASFIRVGPRGLDPSASLMPRYHRSMFPTQSGSGIAWQTDVSLPLWLIAAICLAWPVTSFIVARRRRRARGFEIAAAPEAPTVRQEPERGAIAPD